MHFFKFVVLAAIAAVTFDFANASAQFYGSAAALSQRIVTDPHLRSAGEVAVAMRACPAPSP